MKPEDILPLKSRESDVIYDTPDGTNILPKSVYAAKLSGAIGFGIGVADVIQYSRLKGPMNITFGIANWCVPAVVAGLAYGSVTGLSGQVRGKDGPLNHFLGGLGAGSVVGFKRQCVKTGFGVGIGFGLAAAFMKFTRDQGWEWSPPIYRENFFSNGRILQFGGRTEYGPDGPIKS